MSRPLRIELNDGFYHAIDRGRNRRRLFHNEDYFIASLNSLAEACQRFAMEVHACCVMNHHYPLLLKSLEGNLSCCMRHAKGVYIQRHNRLKKTDGVLFHGR